MRRSSLQPLYFLTLAVLLTACAWRDELTSRGEWEQAFQDEFNFPLPADIQSMQGRDVRVGDTWTRWLAFSVDAGRLQHLATSAKLARAQPADLTNGELWNDDLRRISPNAPPWWRIPGVGNSLIYFRRDYPKDRASRHTVLWFDETTRMAYLTTAVWQ